MLLTGAIVGVNNYLRVWMGKTINELQLLEQADTVKARGARRAVLNKINADLKEMILGVLRRRWRSHITSPSSRSTSTTAFLTLIGKVLPLQITGDGGGPVFVITGVDRDDDSSNSNDPSDASETSIKD